MHRFAPTCVNDDNAGPPKTEQILHNVRLKPDTTIRPYGLGTRSVALIIALPLAT
jgi:hypothetical protein